MLWTAIAEDLKAATEGRHNVTTTRGLAIAIPTLAVAGVFLSILVGAILGADVARWRLSIGLGFGLSWSGAALAKMLLLRGLRRSLAQLPDGSDTVRASHHGRPPAERAPAPAPEKRER